MANFQALNRDVRGIFGALGQRSREDAAREAKIQDEIRLLREKQRIAQADPLQQLLRLSQVGQALQGLNLTFQDVIGGAQPGVSPRAQPGAQPGVQPQVAPTPRPTPRISPVRTPPIVPQRSFGDVTPSAPTPAGDRLITKFKPQTNILTGEVREIPTEIKSRQALIDEKVIGEATKASGKQLETLVKTSGNLSRVEAAFSGLVAQAKRAVNEQGGFGAKQAIGVRARRFGQRLGIGGEIPIKEQLGGLAAFDAQTQEVILALSPILTGQNRILRSALTMLKKTVPQLPIAGTTEAEFTNNLKQSLKNAFKLSLAVSRGLLTPAQITNLTQNATDEQITDFMQGLVDRTQFKPEDEKFFNKFFARVIATPAETATPLFAPGERQFGAVGAGQRAPSFNSVEEAEAANLPAGTEITIGGRRAVVE